MKPPHTSRLVVYIGVGGWGRLRLSGWRPYTVTAAFHGSLEASEPRDVVVRCLPVFRPRPAIFPAAGGGGGREISPASRT